MHRGEFRVYEDSASTAELRELYPTLALGFAAWTDSEEQRWLAVECEDHAAMEGIMDALDATPEERAAVNHDMVT